MKFKSLQDVVDYQMCTGCGACAFYEADKVSMINDVNQGLRPKGRLEESKASLEVCPGIGLEHREEELPEKRLSSLMGVWGPVLEVWEGHASDDAIRYLGSSGGAATALACFALESKKMGGVLHIAAKKDKPFENETVMSTSRDELLLRTGSRYAPASPCDGLAKIEKCESPCVFIGKPCDVAATKKLRMKNSRLNDNLGLTIGVFCAGTPSTKGTLEMIKNLQINNLSEVEEVRYRGKGWPGMAAVKVKGEAEARKLSYEQSWGEILQKFRPWRCHVCADHTGEFSDIAVGDPWYREIPEDEPGLSLIVIRTDRGRKIFKECLDAGYIQANQVDPGLIERSQPNLLKSRGQLWGRIQSSRWMGVHYPRYINMDTFKSWLLLSFKEKVQSFLGTGKRIFKRRLHFKRPVEEN